MQRERQTQTESNSHNGFTSATKNVTQTNANGRTDRHPIEDRYNFHDASFRRHYQLNYSDGGHDYDSYYAPAYRFGFELAEKHQNARWETVTDEAQRHWQASHAGNWDEMVDAIHYGWLENRDPEALRVHHVGEYDDYRKSFLAHYEEAVKSSGMPFDFYEPAYRQGYELAINPTYRTHLWNEMEPEVLRYYEDEYAEGEVPWEHYRDAVQYAWHNVRATGA
ncbi:MAG: hypothetical protein R2867_18815 [Caldilineaceae bacterium]